MGDVFGQQVSKIGLQLGLSLSFSIATVGVVYFGIQKGIERGRPNLLADPLRYPLTAARKRTRNGWVRGSPELPIQAELRRARAKQRPGSAWARVLHALAGHGRNDHVRIVPRQGPIHREKRPGWIVLLDTAIAIVASIIMFSVIFSVAGMREQVGSSPVGMLFISLPPELFYTSVPFGTILAPLFYVLVAFAALTSTIAMLEVTVSYVIDEHRLKRSKATMLSGAAVLRVHDLRGTLFSATRLSSRRGRSSTSGTRIRWVGSPPWIISWATGCCLRGGLRSRSLPGGS